MIFFSNFTDSNILPLDFSESCKIQTAFTFFDLFANFKVSFFFLGGGADGFTVCTINTVLMYQLIVLFYLYISIEQIILSGRPEW